MNSLYLVDSQKSNHPTLTERAKPLPPAVAQAVLIFKNGIDSPPVIFPLASSTEETNRLEALLNGKFHDGEGTPARD